MIGHPFPKFASVEVKARVSNYPDNKVRVVNMGPIWGQQDPGGPHVGPMNFAIWVHSTRTNIHDLSMPYSQLNHASKKGLHVRPLSKVYACPWQDGVLLKGQADKHLCKVPVIMYHTNIKYQNVFEHISCQFSLISRAQTSMITLRSPELLAQLRESVFITACLWNLFLWAILWS